MVVLLIYCTRLVQYQWLLSRSHQDDGGAMFQEDHCYTRNHIHTQLGGGLQDYLPHKEGRIVCACLRPDTNPDAPDILLVGSGAVIYRWACVFCSQKFPIPTFIKVG